MFRKQFKKYKSRCPPPDLSDVVDPRRSCPELLPLRPAEASALDCESSGLRPPGTWRLFRLAEPPRGLLVLENPFTPEGQRRWVRRCLRDFTRKPGCRLNLDAHGDLREGRDWWDACLGGDGALLTKLRWSTLGYHHDWDTKVYSEARRDAFPGDLATLSRVVAEALGFPGFEAQAAIVNFYHLDSTLSGHADRSEEDLEAPLLSFSFGQTALFLVGGPTPEEEARAIFLRSGDVLVMSGESRLSYHAVPRILKEEDDDPPPWGKWGEEEEEDGAPFEDYLRASRINVNVRQVLGRGQTALQQPP